MRLPRLYIALFLLTILVLSAAGYAAFWYAAAGKVRDEIARWSVERRAAGWQVRMDEPRITGFPLRIDVSIATASIAGPGAPPAWAWTAPEIRATATPWNPERLKLFAPGLHLLSVGEETYRVTATAARGELTADERAVRAGRLTFGGISVTRGNNAPITAEDFDIRITQASSTVASAAAAPGPAPASSVSMHARAVTLPEPWEAPLGRTVDAIALEAVVTGALRPGGKMADMLSRWRDSGGSVEVESFEILWRALNLRANGTFALDGKLQPQGATTAEIEGLDQAADALIAAGVIDAKTAFAAKVANQALTVGGGPARIPLTLQGQRVFLGPVPLARIKSIDWN